MCNPCSVSRTSLFWWHLSGSEVGSVGETTALLDGAPDLGAGGLVTVR